MTTGHFVKSGLNGNTVSIQGASRVEGAPLVSNEPRANNNNHQRWVFVPDADSGCYFIESALNGYVLTIKSRSRVDGAPVVAGEKLDSNHAHQLWSVVKGAGGDLIVSKLNGYVLQIKARSRVDGAPLVVGEKIDSNNLHQLWSFDPALEGSDDLSRFRDLSLDFHRRGGALDEYVILTNDSDKPIDLQGLRVHVPTAQKLVKDAGKNVYDFPNSLVLAPGTSVLIFGAGAKPHIFNTVVPRSPGSQEMIGPLPLFYSVDGNVGYIDTVELLYDGKFVKSLSKTTGDAELPSLGGGGGGGGGAPDPNKPKGILISDLFYNGQEGRKEPDEYVELENTETAAVDISGWTLLNQANPRFNFVFPAGTVLAPGQKIKVFTNKPDQPYSFNYDWTAVWPNGGGVAELDRKDGSIAAIYGYGSLSGATNQPYQDPGGTGGTGGTGSGTDGGAVDPATLFSRLDFDFHRFGGALREYVAITNNQAESIDLRGLSVVVPTARNQIIDAGKNVFTFADSHVLPPQATTFIYAAGAHPNIFDTPNKLPLFYSLDGATHWTDTVQLVYDGEVVKALSRTVNDPDIAG